MIKRLEAVRAFLSRNSLVMKGDIENEINKKYNELLKEEEEEASGEIAWDGLEWVKHLSIYSYRNGVKILDWKKFVKKFVYGVFGLGFTLAGSTVMYFTLSGLTQQVALWGTIMALVAAMWLHMQEPSGE